MASDRPEPPSELVQRVAAMALALPEAYEEEAWTGTRWRIRRRTFAHLAMTTPDRIIEYGVHLDAPVPVLLLHAHGEELLALVSHGLPFLKPAWSPTAVSVLIDDTTDWEEIAELVTESYRLMAPRKLGRRLDGEPGG